MSKSLPPFYFVKRGVGMAESIDALQIEINAKASKANDAIDRLCGKIDRLTSSMSHLDGSKLSSMANGVQRLGAAMQTMNNVKTADFSRLARNLQNLNNIDVSKLSNLSVNVKHIATAFNGLSGMDKSAEQITMLASGIKQLGYKSADKAIANIPQLADAVKKMMQELSTAPKVSQNLIDMTNALAKFARTGSSGGKAANTLVNSFNRVSKASIGMKSSLIGAVSGLNSIRRSILSAMGIAGGFYAVFQGIKESINISSDLTEVQNVVDVTFGNFKSKIEDLAKVSIPELGMSELTVKQLAGRYQAMGTAMGFTQGKMSDMSVALTRLVGDMSSFYNVSQEDVGRSLQSIFTGEAEPLRKFGVDLTNASVQEWAMKQGIDANMQSMSQMEKTMLRYQYVMANTGAAQNDFQRTQDTWANQVRILKENFRELASVIGSSFINALKPLVKALNSAMGAIISFAKVVSNALGKIFGWKYEDATGGIANDFEDAAEGADGLASGTGAAADNAKKLKQQLQGIDELNVLNSNNETGTGGGSGGGGGATGGADASGGQWVQTDGILQSYESQLDTLFKLGEHIGQTLTDAMNSIDWNRVYEGARNFGSGLASFLNGLISPELFYATGRTIANSLNTAIYATLSFGETFDFADFGNSIASGINGFFENFDFRALAKTINVWVDGIKTTLVTAIKNIKWSEVIGGVLEFADEIELDTIAIALGAFSWKYEGKEIVSGALSGLLSKQVALGIGTKTIPASASVAVSLIVAKIGWEIGGWLYENNNTVYKMSEAIAKWITKDGTTISLPRGTAVTLTGLTISIGAAEIVGGLTAGTLLPAIVAKASAIMAALTTWATTVLIPAVTTFCSVTLPALMAGLANVLTVAVPIVLSFAFGWQAGEDLFEAGSGQSPDTWGGWGEFLKLDATAEEIRQAIADGAVTEFTITPLIKLLADDDSIDTSEITDAMSEMFSDFMDKTGLGEIAVALTDKDFWKSVPETWKEIGKDITNGLKNGIGDIWKKIKQSFSKFLEKVKDFFGIHSPSTVFEKIGKNIIEGLKKGLGNVWDKIKESFKNVAENALEMLGIDGDKKTINIETIFQDIKNPASKLTSWVLDQIRKKNPFSGNIKSIFTNGNPNSLVSWVFDKIKTTKDDLTKNITSLFKNADENNLISWVMGKIKGSNEDLTKNITSRIFATSNSDSIIYWVMGKIKGDGSGSLTKNINSALLKSAKSNPLVSWFLEKIKGGVGMAKSIISNLTQGSSNSLVTWFLEKIKGGVSLAKSVVAKMDIGGIGYNAFMSFVDMYNSLKSKAIDFALNFSAAAQDLRSWINGNIISKINVVFSKVPILRHHQIPYLANGGMLDGKGQLFVAREKGPELVTSYGNKTAIMNNNQIVESVSGGVEIAVRNANAEQIALLRQQNELLYEILQKEAGISYKEVFEATRKGNSEYKAMHGHSALA